MPDQAVPIRPVTVIRGSRRGRAAAQILWLALCSGLLTAAVMLRPDPRGLGTHEQLGLPPCSFQEMTGLPCPGCGMTTAFANTVRLRFGEAFRANPFGMVLSLSTVVFGAFCLACALTDWRAWTGLGRLATPAFLWSAVGLLIASWAFQILLALSRGRPTP